MPKSQDGLKMAPKFSRKGFEMQFNWIFVLIAGTAILLFFSLVMIKLKDISESSRQVDIVKGIETIITSASVSIDTTNVVEIPDSEIKLDCTSILSGKITKQYQNLILFSPSLIKGDKIVTQTLAFNAPFRSSGLLYATSDKLKYVIVGNNDVAKDINNTLPLELSKELVKTYPSFMSNPVTYRVRFIVAGDINLQLVDVPASLEEMKDEDVTAIKITGDIEKGTAEFYQKEGKRWSLKGSSQYIGKASLIAAAYADTKELYECSMKNAFSKHNLVARIHISRTEKLKAAINNPECLNIYTNSVSQLNSISAASAGLAASMDFANIQELYDASKRLALQNKEAQKFSCPLVY